MQNRKLKVTKKYESAYPEPLKMKAGDAISIGEKESPWDGWLWCAAVDGNKGWVPESYVKRDGDRGHLRVDYDATELTVEVGEELTVISEEADWFRCVRQDGRIGWVPVENVEEL